MTQPAPPDPRHGEIWLAALGAAKKGEVGKTRPVIVVTLDEMRAGTPFDLIGVVPLSTSRTPTTLRPLVKAIDHLEQDSVALCFAGAAISVSRFIKRLGIAPGHVMIRIAQARAAIEGWQ
ncbi:MAG: type II toxin-antitoxin system PemK/MazF family toxin [Micrococcales bacterium]|nr:type II toxin-antitoxin system PemK/MazF family toxin [Micrococcales bacterium]